MARNRPRCPPPGLRLGAWRGRDAHARADDDDAGDAGGADADGGASFCEGGGGGGGFGGDSGGVCVMGGWGRTG